MKYLQINIELCSILSIERVKWKAAAHKSSEAIESRIVFPDVFAG